MTPNQRTEAILWTTTWLSFERAFSITMNSSSEENLPRKAPQGETISQDQECWRAWRTSIPPGESPQIKASEFNCRTSIGISSSKSITSTRWSWMTRSWCSRTYPRPAVKGVKDSSQGKGKWVESDLASSLTITASSNTSNQYRISPSSLQRALKSKSKVAWIAKWIPNESFQRKVAPK